MEINKDTVEYLCELSKLQLDKNNSERMLGELSEMLQYFEEISNINTDTIEPLSYVFATTNVLREDVVKESFDISLILKNAPSKTKNCFIVPRSVAQEGL